MKNQRLFTYVFLFGLLVNGSACGSDHNETDFPETPGGETPPSPSGLQAYMLTTTDTRTYDLRESTVEFEPQASMSPKNILLNPQQIYQTMQVGIVVGGGNFWRGRSGRHSQMDPQPCGSYVGSVLGHPVLNCLALATDMLEQHGVPVRVQTAICKMRAIARALHPFRSHPASGRGPGGDLWLRHSSSPFLHRYMRQCCGQLR